MSKEFVQLEIWDLLEEAKQEPFDVNWNLLWDSLDVSLIVLNSSEQLQVAADALLQMVEVFHLRSMEAFEELEAFTSDDGPVMGERPKNRNKSENSIQFLLRYSISGIVPNSVVWES